MAMNERTFGTQSITQTNDLFLQVNNLSTHFRMKTGLLKAVDEVRDEEIIGTHRTDVGGLPEGTSLPTDPGCIVGVSEPCTRLKIIATRY